MHFVAYEEIALPEGWFTASVSRFIETDSRATTIPCFEKMYSMFLCD